MSIRHLILATAAAVTFALPNYSYAQDVSRPPDRHTYNLSGQPLGEALRSVARVNDRQLIADPSILAGRKAPYLKGEYTFDEAIRILLDGSGLEAEFSGSTIIIRSASPLKSGIAQQDGDIEVTGSRIRGTQSISPMVKLTADEMRQGGITTLADAIRTIPQNFNGGQNPGIGLGVPESRGSYIGGGTGLNLRGLGSDATLTLLNGHRLAYSGLQQSVDISAIPFMAIDRIEVMTDGASAIYGSDAVAGVANVVLRKSYEGIMTSGKWSASTDGGNERQQYGALAGHVWSSGNVMLAMDWQKATPILARQRSYASERAPGLVLSPSLRNLSFLINARQEIIDNVEVRLDGIYSERSSLMRYATTSDGDYRAYGGELENGGSSLSIAPSILIRPSSDWQIELSTLYSKDRAKYRTASFALGEIDSLTIGCYCNEAWSSDLQANGTLFELPAGPVQAAIGGGYRNSHLHGYRTAGAPRTVKASQDNYYAFSEIRIPLASPEQGMQWLHRAELNAAGRYENYPGTGDVFTPKISALLAPNPDIDFKASWGRSFRAPTLYMRYNAPAVAFMPALYYGAGATSTEYVLLLSGGNPDLKPERATSWTASIALHPSWLENARIEVSYFNVAYRDRIAQPITLTRQALSDPAYADFVTRNPSLAAVTAAVEGSVFSNGTGRQYDPELVSAIIYNANRNVSRQNIQGVDIQAEYTVSLASWGSLRLSANASYLDSDQQVSALQQKQDLSGYIFNPPHFQGRGGASWSLDETTVAAFVNHTGGLKDSRVTPITRISAMTTIDLTASTRITSGPDPLRNLELMLSAQNLFNQQPPLRRNTAVYEQPYDPTNASPAGRVISLSLRKEW